MSTLSHALLKLAPAFEDRRFFLCDGGLHFEKWSWGTRSKSSGDMSSCDDTVAWCHGPTLNCHKWTACSAERNLCRRANLRVVPEIVYRERAAGSTPGCQDGCCWKRVVADVMCRTLGVPFISLSLRWLWRRRQVPAPGCAISAFTWKVFVIIECVVLCYVLLLFSFTSRVFFYFIFSTMAHFAGLQDGCHVRFCCPEVKYKCVQISF